MITSAFSCLPTSFVVPSTSSIYRNAAQQLDTTKRSEFLSSPSFHLSMASSSPEESSSNDENTVAQPRRRRRKDGKNVASIQQQQQQQGVADATPPEAEAKEEKPSVVEEDSSADQKPVQMEVMDVRDLMAKGANTNKNAVTAPPSETADDQDDDDEYEDEYEDDEYEDEDEDDEDDDDDDEYEYYFVDDSGKEVIVGDDFGTSLAGSSGELTGSLLDDARAMREFEPTSNDDEESFKLREVVIQALSYLVTADFFFVVFLLLWFFVGIFSAKVLGDDGIYLYFAGLFEPVVQPALGILILGAGLSGVFGKKDEEAEDE